MTTEDSAQLAQLAATVARLDATVAQLAAELREIRAALPRKRRTDVDPESAAQLLRAIAAIGGDKFLVSELIDLAALLDVTAPLPAALLAATGTATNARRIGKYLAAIEGREFGGLELHRRGEERGGVIWEVVRAG